MNAASKIGLDRAAALRHQVVRDRDGVARPRFRRRQQQTIRLRASAAPSLTTTARHAGARVVDRAGESLEGVVRAVDGDGDRGPRAGFDLQGALRDRAGGGLESLRGDLMGRGQGADLELVVAGDGAGGCRGEDQVLVAGRGLADIEDAVLRAGELGDLALQGEQPGLDALERRLLLLGDGLLRLEVFDPPLLDGEQALQDLLGVEASGQAVDAEPAGVLQVACPRDGGQGAHGLVTPGVMRWRCVRTTISHPRVYRGQSRRAVPARRFGTTVTSGSADPFSGEPQATADRTIRGTFNAVAGMRPFRVSCGPRSPAAPR